MNIYRDFSGIEYNPNTVVTLGTFDGLHQGHLNLLDLLVKESKENGKRNFVVTFEPHPRKVVSKDYNIQLLTTMEEKLALFEEKGIENVYVINFTKEFSKNNFRDFLVNYVINPIGVNHIYIGHDHRFGKNRDGDESKVRELGDEFGFGVTVLSAVTVEGEVVSSTKIRNALLEGNTDLAGLYLGRNYSFNGKVIQGSSRGRALGFRTANINPETNDKLIPKIGVYIVKCTIEGLVKYGIMNIGVRPTFEEAGNVVIEAHLFNFEEEIYGDDITVEVMKRLRDEIKFSSKEELINQIQKDKSEAEGFISKLTN